MAKENLNIQKNWKKITKILDVEEKGLKETPWRH
jgi:hypothetical protein